jgi:ABC-type oligopeptide transport system substrate-binding subunit
MSRFVSVSPSRLFLAGAAVAALPLAVLALAACKPAGPTLDPKADPIAREFYSEVRSGADLELSPHLAHELKNPTTVEQLNLFKMMIPTEPESSVELKSWDVSADNTGTTTRLTDVYHYSDHAVLAKTALFKSPSGEDPVIVGFSVMIDNGAGG